MRSLLVVVALFGCGGKAQSSPRAKTDVHVDRRVEIVSIVCALAGFEEYTRGAANAYRSEVVRTFQPFIQHPAVLAMRKLRDDHGISYDAPMTFAVHLDDRLRLVDAGELGALDARWKGVDAAALATQIADFGATSKFDAFFAAHRTHYEAMENALRDAVDSEHPVDWFDATFGKRAGAAYTVVPSPMTGHYDFGVRATESKTLHMFQLIGVDTTTGQPTVDDKLVYLLVHEMAHSYVNPFIEAHAAQLQGPAERVFAEVADKMKAQAYTTWQIFLDESVVRATTVVYLRDRKGDKAAAAALDDEVKHGFLWTSQIADLMRAYQTDHKDYAPRLAALLATLK